MALSDRAEEIIAKQLGNGRAAELRAAMDQAYEVGGNDTLNARGRLLASLLFGRLNGEEFCDISDAAGYPAGSRVEQLLLRTFGDSDGLELLHEIFDAYYFPAPDSDFDFNDSSTTWQDAGGTVPANTASHVVARIDDRIAGGSPLLLYEGTGAVLATYSSGVLCGEFDGATSYLLASSIARHELGAGDFTIVADINPGSSPSGSIFSKNADSWSDPYANYTARFEPTSECEYWCSGYVGAAEGASKASNPSSGVLQLAITQDSSTPSQSLFYNGTKQTETATTAPELVADQGNPLMLGSNAGLGFANFKIRRLRIWKGRVLTSVQLASLQ